VMIALAALIQSSGAALSANVASTPSNLVASSGSPITPGEARKTSLMLQPTALEAIEAVSVVDCRPVLPVKALALPEFTTSARASPPLEDPPLESLARHHSTGADGHFDLVKTPATVVPLSITASSTSVRPLYRMPAAAVASLTPAITGMAGTSVGARGETAVDIRQIPKQKRDRHGRIYSGHPRLSVRQRGH